MLPLFTRGRCSAPEALATLERVRAAMVQAGYGDGDAMNAIYVVGMFTIGHVIFETPTTPRARAATRTFRFGLEALLDGIAAQHKTERFRRKR